MPFDFQSMMDNPQLQYSLALMGSAHSVNPFMDAQTALVKIQEMQALQQQKAAMASMQNQHSALYLQQAANAERKNSIMNQFLPQLMQNMVGNGGGIGGAPQAQVSPAPAPSDIPQQQGPSMQQTGFNPAAQQPAPMPAPAPQQQSTQPNIVDPRAIAADFMFNEGKGIGKMYEEATKRMVLPNGVVVLTGPNGSVSLAPGSEDVTRKYLEMEQGTKGNYETETITFGNQKLEVSKTEARMWRMTGQLPPRYAALQGGQPQSQVAPQMQPQGMPTPTPAPAPAQRGSEQDATQRIFQNGVAEGTPVPTMQNLVAGIAQRTGARMPPQQAPQYSDIQAPSVIPGVQQSAAENASQSVLATDSAKTYLGIQGNAQKALSKIGNMQLVKAYFDKIGNTGAGSPVELGFYKIANALGFDIPEKASNLEAVQGMTRQFAMQLRDPSQGGGMPGQMSNYEDQLLQKMAPSINKLPNANKILADAYIKQQQRTVAEAKLAAQWKAQGVPLEDIPVRLNDWAEAHPFFSKEDAAAINNAAAKTGHGREAGGAINYTPSSDVEDILKKYFPEKYGVH